MELLIDVDAAGKLAHWRLLEELPALSGIAFNEMVTLTSARFRARKSLEKPDGKLFRDVTAAKAAISAIDQMQPTLDVDPALMTDMVDVPGIDAGEAVLLAALDANPQARLLTGDKRALRALAALAPGVRQRFSSRIVIVECVLLAALDAHGLEWLRERVCPWKEIDKSTVVIMGSRCDLGEAAVREGLAAYITEMRDLCEPSLIAYGLS